MESNSKLRCAINGLIQTCKDGEEGFVTAAEDVTDGEMKRLFGEYSLQRSQFAAELQSACQELGDSHPEEESSVSGSLHRGWIDLKSAVEKGDAHAILVECERGESSAAAEYEKVLQLELPAHIRQLVSKQCGAIRAAHEKVRALSDAGAPKWA